MMCCPLVTNSRNFVESSLLSFATVAGKEVSEMVQVCIATMEGHQR